MVQSAISETRISKLSRRFSMSQSTGASEASIFQETIYLDPCSFAIASTNQAQGIPFHVQGSCKSSSSSSFASPACSSASLKDGDTSLSASQDGAEGETTDGILSACPQFVVGPCQGACKCCDPSTSSSSSTTSSPFSSFLGGGCRPVSNESEEGMEARRLWLEFERTGDISDVRASKQAAGDEQQSLPVASSREGTKVAGAVSLRKTVGAHSHKSFPFSLSWDNPLARFGSGAAVPRYYTRFFGTHGVLDGQF